MRIALLSETYVPFINGVVMQIRLMKDTLEAMGHEVLVVTVGDVKTPTVDDGVLRLPSFRVDLHYGYRSINFLRRDFLDRLRAFDPDIIHIHNEYTLGLFGMRAAKRLNKPLVYTIHMDFDPWFQTNSGATTIFRRPLLRYLRRLVDRADTIVSMSRKAERYVALTGCDKPVHIVPNSVCLDGRAYDDSHRAEREAKRQTLGLSDEAFAFVFVGRMSREKRVDVLIDTFLAWDKPADQARLVLIGDGPQKKALEAKVRALGADARVTFLGSVPNDEVVSWLWAMDAYTTASLAEMHSISLIEATASGLYAVVCRDEPNDEQIEVGVTGEMWTQASDFAAIADRLSAESLDLRQARRRQVALWARQHDATVQMRRLLSLYKKTIVGQRAVI